MNLDNGGTTYYRIILKSSRPPTPPPLHSTPVGVSMCLADQRHCALSLWPSDALQRGPETADSFADKSSTWRKWDLMETWALLHFIHAASTRLKAKGEHGHTGRRSWVCLPDSWGLCVIKHCWPSVKTNVLKSTDQSETGVTHSSVGMAGVSLKCCDWPEERSDRQPKVVHLVVFSSSSLEEDRASLSV